MLVMHSKVLALSREHVTDLAIIHQRGGEGRAGEGRGDSHI